MTKIDKHEKLRLIGLILNSLVIGIEVSLELDGKHKFIVIPVVSGISFLILFYILTILNKLGLTKNTMSFTIWMILISAFVNNLSLLIILGSKIQS